jgi:plasmid replication initiation protein
MQRYTMIQFDNNTFVVADQHEQREVCVCANYDDRADAEDRARTIAALLNGTGDSEAG